MVRNGQKSSRIKEGQGFAAYLKTFLAARHLPCPGPPSLLHRTSSTDHVDRHLLMVVGVLWVTKTQFLRMGVQNASTRGRPPSNVCFSRLQTRNCCNGLILHTINNPRAISFASPLALKLHLSPQPKFHETLSPTWQQLFTEHQKEN